MAQRRHRQPLGNVQWIKQCTSYINRAILEPIAAKKKVAQKKALDTVEATLKELEKEVKKTKRRK
jgi:hypothetical protein